MTEHFKGFEAFDVIRPLVWNDKRVKVYYRQNCILYLKSDRMNDAIKREIHKRTYPVMSNVVHPESYLRFADPDETDLRRLGLRRLLAGFPKVLSNSVCGRVQAHFTRVCHKLS